MKNIQKSAPSGRKVVTPDLFPKFQTAVFIMLRTTCLWGPLSSGLWLVQKSNQNLNTIRCCKYLPAQWKGKRSLQLSYYLLWWKSAPHPPTGARVHFSFQCNWEGRKQELFLQLSDTGSITQGRGFSKHPKASQSISLYTYTNTEATRLGSLVNI